MTASREDQEMEARAAEHGQLKTPVEARQGVTTHHIRWVLGISLALGVLVLGGAYAWYASMQSQAQSPAAASAGRESNG
jgi:hypothetical protein